MITPNHGAKLQSEPFARDAYLSARDLAGLTLQITPEAKCCGTSHPARAIPHEMCHECAAPFLEKAKRARRLAETIARAEVAGMLIAYAEVNEAHAEFAKTIEHEAE